MIDWFLMMFDIVKLYLLSDWPVDIQIGALLTSSCGISGIQVTIKAGGPLVYSYCCICLFYNIVWCILYIGGKKEYRIKILSLNSISFFYQRYKWQIYINIAWATVIMYDTFLGHASHSGDQMLWDGVRRHPSCVYISSNLN